MITVSKNLFEEALLCCEDVSRVETRETLIPPNQVILPLANVFNLSRMQIGWLVFENLRSFHFVKNNPLCTYNLTEIFV